MKTYQNAIGKQIVLDTETDLSTAVNPKIKYRKPDGTTIGEWAAVVIESTKIRYYTQDGDLNQIGTYYLQAISGLPGYDEPGETDTLKVYEAFK